MDGLITTSAHRDALGRHPEPSGVQKSKTIRAGRSTISWWTTTTQIHHLSLKGVPLHARHEPIRGCGIKKGGRTYPFFRKNNSWAMTQDFCDVGSGFKPLISRCCSVHGIFLSNRLCSDLKITIHKPPTSLICSVRWVWQQCNGHDKLDVHLRLDHLCKDKQHIDQADPLRSQLQVRILNLNPFLGVKPGDPAELTYTVSPTWKGILFVLEIWKNRLNRRGGFNVSPVVAKRCKK